MSKLHWISVLSIFCLWFLTVGSQVNFSTLNLKSLETNCQMHLGISCFFSAWDETGEKKIRINLKACSTSGLFYFQQRTLWKEGSLLKKNSYNLWVKSICLNLNFCIKTGGISMSSVIINCYIRTLEVDYWLTSNWYGSVGKYYR